MTTSGSSLKKLLPARVRHLQAAERQGATLLGSGSPIQPVGAPARWSWVCGPAGRTHRYSSAIGPVYIPRLLPRPEAGDVTGAAQLIVMADAR
jgi:hypothetical protein